MAIAVQSGRRHVVHRPPWVRRRTSEHETALPFVMVVVLAVVVMAVIWSSSVLDISLPRFSVANAQSASASRPAQGATPVAKLAATTASVQSVAPAPPLATLTPAAPAQAAPTAAAPRTAPARTALAVGARARVVNTDNLGVVFYSAPREGARLPAGLLEGTVVTVMELSGEEWARVQSDAKKSGWVRAQYVAPAE